KNFKKGFVGDYGVKMTPKKLCNFCELNWLSFDIGWPPEAAHCPASTSGSHWTPGHPDQFPYTDSWLLIAQTLPPWARFCMNKQGQTPAQPAPDPLPDSPPPSMFPHHLMSKTPALKTQGAQQVNKDAHTIDLLNWKHHNPAYTEAMPEMRPNWDSNTREGQEILGCYHDALLHGLQVGAKKPTNILPTDFYERLCEAFWTYIPSDPETAENQQMINAAFVAQSYTDIQRKLQQLKGFPGMNATQLLEVANKVFVN
ncbi:hypothetical protein FD755_002536, partial [Muntiacus reevesi]